LSNPENKEKAKIYSKKYGRKYYEENKEELSERNKKWREENPEKIAAWRERIKPVRREYNRKYSIAKYNNDPLHALRLNLRTRIGQIFKSKRYNKSAGIYELLGCNADELMNYLESQFDKNMNWDNKGEWHVDHIIPLASAENENELTALCHFSNLQPLWENENLKKSDNYDPKDKEAYLKWYYSEFPDKEP